MSLPANFEDRLKHYINEVSRANTEPAKAFLFLEFIRKVFHDINADYAERLFPDLEKYIRYKQGVIVTKGRIDALLGNLIIEFETDLNLKLDEAKDQLKHYVAILWSKQVKNRVSYVAMASDGIIFEVYRPRSDVAPGQILSKDSVYLDQIDRMNLREVEPRDVYLWFDRYLLIPEFRPISTEEFVREFGSNSPAFKLFIEEVTKLWSQAKNEEDIKTLFEEWRRYLRIVYGTPVESEELFFKHTYLATLAKLMAYSSFAGGTLPSHSELLKILKGESFREWGILNFLEEDFFSWIVREPTKSVGLKLANGLLSHLSRYDMRTLNEDIMKGLYQELVDPAERHDLGEYYTPDWLAEYILKPLIEEDVNRSVIDPACGSGTFLFTAIRLKKESNKKIKNSELLEHLLRNTVGIDIHPLAVIVAKANYLIALGDLLQARRGSISIPIYLADSIRLPEERITPYGNLRVYQFPAYNKILGIPELIINQGGPDITDKAIDLMREYATKIALKAIEPDLKAFQNLLMMRINELGTLVNKAGIKLGDLVTILHSTALDMAEFVASKRDTIWAYVLKNVYRPLFLKELKFDIVVGNPPWLSYRYAESIEYQDFLKKMILEHYSLLQSSVAKLITQMELATLFFVRTADLYLKEGKTIAFVMPRGVFTADQHDAFRKREFQKVRLNFTKIIDLDKVKPVFNISSCVFYAHKTDRSIPIEGVVLEGTLPKKNLSLKEAEAFLKFAKKEFFLETIGARSFITDKKLIATRRRSHYYEMFRQGASIVPRAFWFVDIIKHPKFGLNKQAPFVKSSVRAMERAKEDYKGITLKGQIEVQFIYATLTSSEIVPFAHLPLPTVILPVNPYNERYRIIDVDEALSKGFGYLHKWLFEVNSKWQIIRGEKAEKFDLNQWLNYQGKLTEQNPKDKFKVLYTTSGTILTASLVDLTQPLVTDIDSLKIPLSGFVAESTVYHYGTNSEEEAYYLCSILNSSIIDQAVKPMQARGLWGPRHFHKKVLELPIPKYNRSNPVHSRLAKLGKLCRNKADRTIPNLLNKYKSIAKIRNEIRKELNDALQEIDSLVIELLGSRNDPDEATLDSFVKGEVVGV